LKRIRRLALLEDALHDKKTGAVTSNDVIVEEPSEITEST
jgi:hypothetical protein